MAGFEIDLEMLLRYLKPDNNISFDAYNEEDLTVTTSDSYNDTLEKVRKDYPNSVITPGVIYQAEGQKDKNITFHIKTLIC